MNKFQEVLSNYDWVLKIIHSSITRFQCDSCENLIKSFETRYVTSDKDIDRKEMVSLLKENLLRQRELLNNIIDDEKQENYEQDDQN